MPDELDIADDQARQTFERELAAHNERAASAPKLKANGTCHSMRCAEDFPAGDKRLFCNAECAADHQRMARI